MIITVTLNPALDKYAVIENFKTNSVNRVTRCRIDAGGKGINVAKLLTELGFDTLAMGVIGASAGSRLKSLLDQSGVNNELVAIDDETRTNLKIYDTVNKTYTDINEPGYLMTPAVFKSISDALFSRARSGDTAVISGKPPRGTDEEALASWITRLQDNGVRTAVDMEGKALETALKRKPFLIKPNEHELAEVMRLPDTKTKTLLAAAKQLADTGIEHVVVSMGARGALFVNKNEAVLARCDGVSAVSTVGAGDALLAAYLGSVEEGNALRDAARFAVAAATAKVLCEGTKMPSAHEIKEKLLLVEVKRL